MITARLEPVVIKVRKDLIVVEPGYVLDDESDNSYTDIGVTIEASELAYEDDDHPAKDPQCITAVELTDNFYMRELYPIQASFHLTLEEARQLARALLRFTECGATE